MVFLDKKLIVRAQRPSSASKRRRFIHLVICVEIDVSSGGECEIQLVALSKNAEQCHSFVGVMIAMLLPEAEINVDAGKRSFKLLPYSIDHVIVRVGLPH